MAVPGTTYLLQGGDQAALGFASTVYWLWESNIIVASAHVDNNNLGNVLQILTATNFGGNASFATGNLWGNPYFSNIQVTGDSNAQVYLPGDFAITTYPQQPSGSAQIVVVYRGDDPNGDLYATKSAVYWVGQ